MINREQFIELSGLVFQAEQWGLKTVTFQDNLMMLETANHILDAYRKENLEITSTGQIPDNIAKQNTINI